MEDRMMELLLTLKDRILNIITFGIWEYWQGSKRVSIYWGNEAHKNWLEDK